MARVGWRLGDFGKALGIGLGTAALLDALFPFIGRLLTEIFLFS